MPRIRTIKPEFFNDPDVADLSPRARLFFIGLWLYADREGRLEDNMRRLKAQIFPYDDVDCESLAVELHVKDMIRRYPAVEKHGWIVIRNFLKHQRPHPKEPASVSPELDLRTGKCSDLDTIQPCKKTEGTPVSGSGITKIFTNGVRSLESGDQKSSSEDFEQFRSAYPASRRVGGTPARRAFVSATQNRNGTHFAMMLTALEQHKRSEQWQTPKLIPLMTTWLNQERWTQVLPECRPSDITSTNNYQRGMASIWKCAKCRRKNAQTTPVCMCGEGRPS